MRGGHAPLNTPLVLALAAHTRERAMNCIQYGVYGPYLLMRPKIVRSHLRAIRRRLLPRGTVDSSISGVPLLCGGYKCVSTSIGVQSPNRSGMSVVTTTLQLESWRRAAAAPVAPVFRSLLAVIRPHSTRPVSDNKCCGCRVIGACRLYGVVRWTGHCSGVGFTCGNPCSFQYVPCALVVESDFARLYFVFRQNLNYRPKLVGTVENSVKYRQ